MCRVVESSRTSDVSTNGFSGPGGLGGRGGDRIPILDPRNSERASVITEGRLGRVIMIYTNLCTKTVTICHGGSDFLEA